MNAMMSQAEQYDQNGNLIEVQQDPNQIPGGAPN
jgi:hypothetical protein